MKRRIKKEIPESHEFADNEPYTNRPLNPEMLAIRCGINTNEIPKFEDIYPQKKRVMIGGFIGQLLDTFLYPSEEGQIRSEEERKQTVELSTVYEIPNSKIPGITKENLRIALQVTDFASPNIDRARSKKLENKSSYIADAKEALIKQAYDTVKKTLYAIFFVFISLVTSCKNKYPIEKRILFEIDTSTVDKSCNINIQILKCNDTLTPDLAYFNQRNGNYCGDSIRESYMWDSLDNALWYGSDIYTVDYDTIRENITAGSDYYMFVVNNKFRSAYRLLNYDPCNVINVHHERVKCNLQRIEPGTPPHYVIADQDGSHEFKVPVLLTKQQVLDYLHSRNLYPPPPNRKRSKDYSEE